MNDHTSLVGYAEWRNLGVAGEARPRGPGPYKGAFNAHCKSLPLGPKFIVKPLATVGHIQPGTDKYDGRQDCYSCSRNFRLSVCRRNLEIEAFNIKNA
jgi:hypothetical protein